MRKSHRGKTVFVCLVLLLSLLASAFSGYRLWKAGRMYAEGDRHYDSIAQSVHRPDSVPLLSPDTDLPSVSIDFAALRQMNPDAVAWIYSPGTVIDYPVMQTDDYDRYLRHLPDGTHNANGSLFLDYSTPADFSGGLNIIYGHNMKNGKMFGSLIEYNKQAYFEEHPYLYLDTAHEGYYRVDLLYGCLLDVGEWRDRAFMSEENLEDLLDYAARHTTFDSSTSYSEQDRILVLSTCSYEFDDARYIVVGVLRPQDEAVNR